MKLRYLLYSLVLIILSSSCKTEFEKIRSSNEPELIFKTANDYYNQEEYLNAQTLYELVIPYYRGKAEAEDLFYQFAYCHYYLKQYQLASHYFSSFSRTYYNSERKEEAEFMSAYSKYQLSPNAKLDQSFSADAIDEMQSFINKYPTSLRVKECNDLIDEMRAKLEVKAFMQGELYFKTGNHISAIKSFENMLKDFPETDRAEEVRFLILKSGDILANNSVYEKKRERFEKVLSYHDYLIRRFPNSKFKKDARGIRQNAEAELKKFKV